MSEKKIYYKLVLPVRFTLAIIFVSGYFSMYKVTAQVRKVPVNDREKIEAYDMTAGRTSEFKWPEGKRWD